MALRVSFDLEESDLNHFRLIMREARKAAATAAPEDIVAGAENLLAQVSGANVPGFIRERLDNLELMIRMLSDHEWRLPRHESARVLNALAYFSEPDDLIPDHIPGLGFLDDAIMIELVARELKHEIEAYRDFCDFRAKQPAGTRSAGVTREEWLAERRKELQSRMRRRRRRNAGASGKTQPRIFS
ncbi:MAG TPA: YkvA family protein [Woeseiaceae bacterium]|nr:YkvA family protein [Woeseiaceae bacterium]